MTKGSGAVTRPPKALAPPLNREHTMSDHPQETQTWIDRTATLFDQATREGQRPRIEDFLMGVTEPRRSQLLEELLRVEVEYRRKAGEKPTAGEYAKRFREHGTMIHDRFRGDESYSIAACSEGRRARRGP